MESYRESILDRIKYFADKHPSNEAVVFVSPTGGREALTWRELFVNICRTGTGFANLGVKSNEFVVISMRNCFECLYAIYGSMMIGAIPCCTRFYFQDGRDIKSLVNQLKTCSMIVIDPNKNDQVWNTFKGIMDSFSNDGLVVCPELPSWRYIVCNTIGRNEDTKGLLSIADLIKENNYIEDLPIPNARDVSVVIRSSGSTGVPKLVHTSQLVTPLTPLYRPCKLYQDISYMSSTGFPSVFVANGYTTVQATSCDEIRDINMRNDVVRKEHCKMLAVTVNYIAETIRYKIDHQNDWPVEILCTGGLPISPSVIKGLKKSKMHLYISYGSSETGQIARSLVSTEDNFTDGRVGTIPPKNEVKIIDGDGNDLGPSTRGEIIVKTPQMFKSYVNDKQATEAAFTSDGWFKTGDIGSISEDMKLSVFGRKGNKIFLHMSAQVDPDALESVFKSFDDVEDAVIVPVHKSISHKMMCACIVPKPKSGLSEGGLRKKYDSMFITGTNIQGGNLYEIDYYMFFTRLPTLDDGNKISRKCLEKIANRTFGKSDQNK